MEYAVAVIAGFVVALASSAPVGPINFAIFQTVYSKGRIAALMIGVGGMIADAILALLGMILYGLMAGDGSDAFFKWLNLLTIPVLIYLGLTMIKNRAKIPEKQPKFKAANGIFFGAMLGLSNPVLLAYWIWIASMMDENNWVTMDLPHQLAFTIGVAGGITLFFIGFIALLARTTGQMSLRLRAKVSFFIGIGFLVFAAYIALRFLLVHLLGVL